MVCGDLTMFSDFLSVFLTKEFVDPKGMFRKICRQHPFEFLIMFDFLGYSCITNDFGDFHVSLLQNEFFDFIGNSSFSYRIHLGCKCPRDIFSMCFSAESIDSGQNLFLGEILSGERNVNAKLQRLKKFIIYVFLLDIF